MADAAPQVQANQAQNPANALLNLVGKKDNTKDVADQFRALVAVLAGGKVDQAALINANLVKADKGGNAAADPLKALQTVAAKLAGPKTANATDEAQQPALTAEQISQLSALFVQFPNLQALLTCKIDPKTLQEITDTLAAGKMPDLGKFNLSPQQNELLSNIIKQPDAAEQMGQFMTAMKAMPHTADGQVAMDDVMKKLVAAAEALKDTGKKIHEVKNSLQEANEKTDKATAVIQQASEKAVDNVVGLQGKRFDPVQMVNGKLVMAHQHGDEKPLADVVAAPAKALPNPKFVVDFANPPEQPIENMVLDVTPKPASDVVALAQNAASTLQTSQMSLLNSGSIETYATLQARVAGNMHPAAMQVALQIQQNAQIAKNNQMIMQLYPEELGKIQVSLKFEGNRVSARIASEKQETLDLLKSDAGALNKALQAAGLNTDAGSLEFSLGQNFQNSAQADKNKSGKGNEFGTMLANDIPETHVTELRPIQPMMLEPGKVDVKL